MDDLRDRTRPLDDARVATILGARAAKHWDAVRASITSDCPAVTEQWKHYGGQSSWTLVIKSRKRTVCYLYPDRGRFEIAFVFGNRAVEAAREADWLPPVTLEKIESARPYMEGRGFRVEVRTAGDLTQVRKLVALKMAN